NIPPPDKAKARGGATGTAVQGVIWTAMMGEGRISRQSVSPVRGASAAIDLGVDIVDRCNAAGWLAERVVNLPIRTQCAPGDRCHRRSVGDQQMEVIQCLIVYRRLADRLDGKPAQILEHSDPDSEPKITKIVREIVHTWPSPEELHSIEDGIFELSNGNG